MTRRHVTTLIAGAALASLTAVAPAAAHTETDHVALPAGTAGTLVLRPTHGCGAAGTVEVMVRAPVEGATAGEVAGWTASAEPDGGGNSVLTWTDGLLPTDQAGAFPIEFEVPDAVGELLVFPAVQICENGEELAWIDGDPASAYPAPRILVLSPGSAPAGSLDDVPPDAPGRDQLVAVIDVDNPTATTSAATSTTSTTPAAATSTTSTSTTITPDATDVPAGTTAPEAADDVSSTAGTGLLIPVLIVAAVAALAFVVVRRR